MTLSIVIPAFNEEKYIGDCLKSCLKFAPANLREIIVVDNASTDRTAEVARGYGPLVRVVSQPKKGLTHARQAGFEAAQGDIMMSIDAVHVSLHNGLTKCRSN
jgi:glycosyltransferase involved in cell wall biosynthesis